MPTRQILRATWLALPFILTACGADEPASPAVIADRVVVNARIYTVDGANPWAEAVAIKGNEFLFVGDTEGANAYVGDATIVSDLGGRFVMPGIIDGHTHPGYIDIEGYDGSVSGETQEDFMASVRDAVEANPGDDWLRLCCWPNHLFVAGSDGPHKRDLDAIVADRPVWITSGTWHSSWMNSKALERIGVGIETPDPRRGIAVYHRDAEGALTGWVKEGAGWQHFVTQFAVDEETHQKSVVAFLDTLSEHGVTTVYDGGNMGYDDYVYAFLARLEREGRLPLRYEGTYQIFVPERRHTAVAEMKRLRDEYGGERLKFRTIKLFMDGIHENHTGSMLAPYVNDPIYAGETMLSVDELRDFLVELHEERFDLHIHTIGDLAVRAALDGIEAARRTIGAGFYPRVTLSHLQSIHPQDTARFAELDVSANFTPWWHGVDVNDVVADALGPELAALTYTARPLFDSGGNVTFSSDDWRLDVLNPFLGMQVGHVRQYPADWVIEAGGGADAFRPPATEKLELELMIRGYTINGAIPFRMEDRVGSIEAGKLADLVVLDVDPFDADPGELHRIKPSIVMMEGEILHGVLD